MTQQTIFDYIVKGHHLYTADGFVSNGHVVVRLVANYEFNNTRMAEAVFRYRSASLPPVARFVAKLPPIGDLPYSLVFAPADINDDDIDRFIFINADFYKLITGGSTRYITQTIETGQLVVRGRWEETKTEAKLIPMLAMYDFDGDLLGFCAGLDVDDYRDEVRAALLAIFATEAA
jgi:hypothetical protein